MSYFISAKYPRFVHSLSPTPMARKRSINPKFESLRAAYLLRLAVLDKPERDLAQIQLLLQERGEIGLFLVAN